MVRIALVQTYHPYTQFTHVHPLGIMMIAAQARAAGHRDVHLLDMKVEGWTPERCLEELVRLAPDVVGVTASRPNGLTYRLKIDKCSGVILAANLLDQQDYDTGATASVYQPQY